MVAAVLLVPGPAPRAPIAAPGTPAAPAAPGLPPLPASDDGLTLDAHLQSSAILGAPHDEDIVLDIRAQAKADHVRPPIALAVVIDRSGSMEGRPIANAKAAANKLVDALAPSDTFSIVTFSSGSEVVQQMGAATATNKAHAHDAISRIVDDGGTCTSCGLDRAVAELSHVAPAANGTGVRRIVLISDGHANEGIWDKDQLVDMSRRIAGSSASISTVGVGLDFDEITMTRIAEVGRGNYYFVEDTANLGAMFDRELDGLADTVATDVRVVLPDGAGVRAVSAYGYPATRDGAALVIPVSDVRAGEARKVVVRVHCDGALGVPGELRVVAEPQLAWRGVGESAGPRHAYARLQATLTSDPAAITAGADHAAVQAVEEARSAEALDEVTHVYETQGYAAAEAVMQQHTAARHARKDVDAAAMTKLDAESGEAMDMLKTMPAPKAAKSVRAKSYELAR